MGPRKRPPASASEKILPENDDSALSMISVLSADAISTTSSITQSHGLIRLKPLSALISEDSGLSTISSQFAFDANSHAQPQPALLAAPPEDPIAFNDNTRQAPQQGSPSPPVERDLPASQLDKKPDPVFITPKKIPRKFKKKLTGNYHKVTDFFSATPRKSLNFKVLETSRLEKENVSHNTKDLRRTPASVSPQPHVPQFSDSKSKQPVTKFEIHRKLCRSTNLRQVSNRQQAPDQTKMSRFLDGGGEGCSYFATHKSSHFPVSIKGEFDVEEVVKMLQERKGTKSLLDIQVETEDKSILIDLKGQVDMEPQAQLLTDIRKALSQVSGVCVKEEYLRSHSNAEGIEMDDIISISSSISDTEDLQYVPEEAPVRKAPTKGRSKGRKTAKKRTKSVVIKKTKENPVCPSYKVIKDTQFAVDAFRFGVIDGVTHYFLTHFHSDHYVGLKRGFSHPIYMSPITANLVRRIIKVEEQFIHTIELNSPVVVDDVEITAIDANHCPGAVMFVFKLPSGRCILHTGDFRATPEMEMKPIFWNNHISCVYLDTTYLSNKANHPKQADSIAEIIRQARQYQEENIGEKYVLIVGTYVIGKERVWAGLARELGCRVWLEKSRLEAVECYEDSSLLEFLEVDPTKALIHVLPLQNLFYENLVEYLGQYEHVFTRTLAIRPSGWERAGAKVQKRRNVSILGVQYSEHSSYPELERFVRHLQPDEVISTVPNGKDLTKVPNIPARWMSKQVEPKRSGQRTISCFLKVKRSSGVTSTSKDGEGNEEEMDEEGVASLSMRVHVDPSEEGEDY